MFQRKIITSSGKLLLNDCEKIYINQHHKIFKWQQSFQVNVIWNNLSSGVKK